jgi:hypothetical protein
MSVPLCGRLAGRGRNGGGAGASVAAGAGAQDDSYDNEQAAYRNRNLLLMV